MKHTYGPPFRYDDVMWYHIRGNLARVDIDADTATVGEELHPLRAELERQAQEYRHFSSVQIATAREVIDETEDNLKKIAVVRNLFFVPADDDSGPYASWLPYLLYGTERIQPGPFKRAMTGDERATEIHQFLRAVEVELEEQVKRVRHGSEWDAFRYEGGRHNAIKPGLCSYLRQLAAVWDELVVGKATPPSRHHCINFVWYCAAPVARRNRIKVTQRSVRRFLSNKKDKNDDLE